MQVYYYKAIPFLFEFILNPFLWLCVLIGNYIRDGAVLFAVMQILKIKDKFKFYGKYIGKIFIFELIIFIIGVVVLHFLFINAEAIEYWQRDERHYRYTIPVVIISSFVIFILNYFNIFKKQEKRMRIILSVALAVFTAPYIFILPIYLETGTAV